VDALKVDRSFVARLGATGADGSVARTIVGLAHSLGLQAVAEGVETPLQERKLRALRCERAQGVRFSAPVGAEGIARLLTRVGAAAPAPPRRRTRTGAGVR
jgi:EAL domain-containing protein (putative c-di-GMP-specific phosphodiesterase class I)